MQPHPHERRTPRRSRTQQGLGIVIAGTVAAAAVVAGTLMAGETGGDAERPGVTRAEAVPGTGQEEAGTRREAGARPVGAAAEHAQRIVALVNAARARAGCPPLRVDSRLRGAAQGHADDMADRDYYAHNNPEGRDAGDRMEAAGYNWRTWGENIHRGPRDPARAVRDWLASAGHRKNIVNCEFKDIGVGVNLRSNGPWWVQNFGVAG
ncbi:CAP domain-containing protein [Streptomyces sp. NPDC049837]|uniref:CAP domain-containing protein n=1 Tax=Streptomyces sp. NPDC049837 TaxID=3155277 RepID=UPI003412E16B